MYSYQKRISSLIFLFFAFVTVSAAFGQSIQKDTFAQRRQNLIKKMNGGIGIFIAEKQKIRNSDITFEYRQSSNYYYLTGFEEPSTAFLLIPGAEKEFIMFVRKPHPMIELWEGKKCSPEEAMEIYGADTAYTIDKFDEVLTQYLDGKSPIYYDYSNEKFNRKLEELLPQIIENSTNIIKDPEPQIAEMRLFKDPNEVELIHNAAKITAQTHYELMKALEPGMTEKEIEGMIDYIFKKKDAPRWGFRPIIASGETANTLHYMDNNGIADEGELLMIDIGAEYKYYSADVTRTIPVNGKFTTEQKEIYDIALQATNESVKAVKPGIGVKKIYDKSAEVISEGLYKLGLMTSPDAHWQMKVWYSFLCTHSVGLDPHDPGNMNYDKDDSRKLEPGMVFAIEPGIYINNKLFEKFELLAKYLAPDVSKEDIVAFQNTVRPAVEKYANICCRLEDDVLVTEDGYLVLSDYTPRTTEEIEELMKQKSFFNLQ